MLPGDVLDIIDENDLIAPLTDYVLECSIRQMSEWQQHNLHLAVSVNMSARFIKDLSFPDRLERLLAQPDGVRRGRGSAGGTQYLASLNCERAQGYLLGPAVAAEKIESLCQTWRSIKSAPAKTSHL
ncbi:MAG: EAL domain-containing protein [Woeseia sp.]